ncbi:dephospho-CoA kinase [Paraliobacillus ryukyuensis]|uniref:dephospho-CoA kinase n=1 Tax=Paraliobacillus ryukyuensis TaxID=200904 RepID=UPI0009A725D8|nr:dephospho-CoA kinase [Paraliobacillus ryukyuensis]
MSKVIGLTGSIGTGKSTVSNFLKGKQIPIIDADVVSREVVEPGQVAYQQIIETFGTSILQSDRQIDRKALGRIVFSDETSRKQLNEIVHPQVHRTMLAKRDHYLNEGIPIIVLDIPLLFENHLQQYVDLIVVVYTTPEIQLQRLMERDQLTKEEAQSRINAQTSIDTKAKQADMIIDNSGTFKETKQQCNKLLEDLQSEL